MKKRTFLKLSSTLLTGATLSPWLGCNTMKGDHGDAIRNWAGNLTYSTTNVSEPATLTEVREVVAGCRKARALGTRHCFNRIADSDANLISTRLLNRVVALDPTARQVTVEAGMRYGELCQYLDERGFAVHNLASLPHISVVGACATATHGSGAGNGNLATAVAAMELVRADGEVVNLSRGNHPEAFYGAVVNLGALGVVTKVTLDLVPAFQVRQDVYLNLPMQQLGEHFDEIMSAGYSVSLFTDWQSGNVNQVWIKSVVEDGTAVDAAPEFFGATAAVKDVHPIIELSSENCTAQMGVAGPWYDRLPHFKLGFTPSSGEELQAEYFIRREKAVEAIMAVAALKDEIGPVLMITEIRAIDRDEYWMSPCYQQPSIAIHFTLKQEPAVVDELLQSIEKALAPFDARPHWGKLFVMDDETIRSRYRKFPDFRQLAESYDPDGKFRNEFLDSVLFGRSSTG